MVAQKLLTCVCIPLCTTAVHNTAQNSCDNLPSYPLDNHHCSDPVYWREDRVCDTWSAIHTTKPIHHLPLNQVPIKSSTSNSKIVGNLSL